MNAAQNGVKDSSSVDTWEVRAPEKGQLYFTHPHVFQTLISLSYESDWSGSQI